MAELFEIAGTPDPANDRVPYFDASETLVNQLKNCSPRTLVNSGLELQANGDSTSAIVRHTSLGYITGHIPIASPDTLANSLPAGSITGTPVITPGASLLVQFVIASAIGANGYNVYKRRCGKSGATNWRGVDGWELEASVETAGTVNLDLALGSWEIAVQTVSDLQKGAITYVFRTDSGTVVGGAVDSATITQDTSGVLITPVISGTFANIHVFHRRQKEDGSFGPLQEELFASSDTVLVIPNMDTGNTWFYLIAEDDEYYNTAYVSLGYYVETPGVAEIMENGGGGGSVDVSGKMNKSANLSDVVDTVDALNNIGGLPKSGGTLTGPVFAAHAFSVSESELGAGTALTVGKAHTVTLSANRTITFSGAPVDGDTIQLVATVTTACTLTFPASYRNGELASTVTTLDLTLGKHCLVWKRTAGTWLLFDPIGASPGAAPDDTAYGAGWNGSALAPTQNALYDYLETLGGGGGGETIESRRAGGCIFDDFHHFATSTTLPTGTMGLVSKSGNGGSVGVATVTDATAMGVLSFATGTTTNGYGTAISETAMIRLGGGAYVIEWRVRFPAIADGTDDFTARFGLGDNITGANPSDGVFFRYNNGTGGKFQAVCRAGGVETTSDHAGTIIANTWYKLRAAINAGATSVTFTIDDADSVTIATNVPNDSASRVTSVSGGITKTAGTTARTVLADYVGLQYALTR